MIWTASLTRSKNKNRFFRTIKPHCGCGDPEIWLGMKNFEPLPEIQKLESIRDLEISITNNYSKVIKIKRGLVWPK